uniref:Uncharacterized protein n=1 Tax=Anopheles atroparvus TaxID=41427 RepID=A0AAG5CRC7_ANOAO
KLRKFFFKEHITITVYPIFLLHSIKISSFKKCLNLSLQFQSVGEVYSLINYSFFTESLRQIFGLFLIITLLVCAFEGLPVPDHAKIRIHVPIKHH